MALKDQIMKGVKAEVFNHTLRHGLCLPCSLHGTALIQPLPEMANTNDTNDTNDNNNDRGNPPPSADSISTRLIKPNIPIDDASSNYPKSTEPSGRYRWNELIRRANDPVWDCTPTSPPEFLGAALANRSSGEDSNGEEPTDTHLKYIADSFFSVWRSTSGFGLDPGIPIVAWWVYVDENFLPDPQIKDRGLIAQTTPKYTRHTLHQNNRWICYTLFCLVEELGIWDIVGIDPIETEEEKEMCQGFDWQFQVDHTFKRIWNAVIDCYQRNLNIKTLHDNPALFANEYAPSKERPGEFEDQVQKFEVREVDVKPWLHESRKYAL